MNNKKLNLDIAQSILELQSAVNQFSLKNIFYKTLFKTKGLEFESYGSYSSGDDASSIDWKASARANKLLVKQYREEKDMKIMFVVDVSDSMVFGSTKKLKCEYAAEMLAALSYLLVSSRDRIGFILFDGELRNISMPLGGIKQFNVFVDLLSDGNNYGGKPSFEKALDFLIDYVDESVAAVIMVSDFLHLNEKLRTKISLIGGKFETIAIMVRDPLDNSMPNVSGELIIEDPQSGEQLTINPKLVKKQYDFHSAKQLNMVRSLFDYGNIDLLELNTNDFFVAKLTSFLKSRLAKRGKYNL